MRFKYLREYCAAEHRCATASLTIKGTY